MNIVSLIVLALVALAGVALMRTSVIASGARRVARRGLFAELVAGTPYDLVSPDAQSALEEFSNDFALAYEQGATETWARENGLYRQTKALKTTFPVPLNAALYKEFEGDVKYRDLFEKSLDMKSKTWQDGVSILAKIVEAPDFVGWLDQPGAMAAAGLALPNEIIAGLLEENPTCFDKLAFFHDTHPFDVLKPSTGTFDNDFTGAGTHPCIANLALAKERFRKIKGPNGKPLGLRMTHVIAPPAQEEEWLDILKRDLVLEAFDDGTTSGVGQVRNRHMNTVKLIVADELTDDTKFYTAALNKAGMHGWIVQDGGTPEEIRSDKTSHLYTTQLKVGVAYILEGNGALALPQCMQRWAGTAPA